ncbi:MAG: aldo/keto reductase [Candidatus Hydrogenedentes bacterium]|nr:aldo/keto reductase [Candidatus Hydrogenedentota bacterium]
MIYRPLGPSGMNVSVISFGAWQIGDDDFWGPDERADAKRTVQEALDAGVNFFDTAEAYGKGESERVLGKCLGSRRREVLLASKVSTENCAPDRLRAACEGSLKRLGTDYLDLYQVHWPPPGCSLQRCGRRPAGPGGRGENPGGGSFQFRSGGHGRVVCPRRRIVEPNRVQHALPRPGARTAAGVPPQGAGRAGLDAADAGPPCRALRLGGGHSHAAPAHQAFLLPP